MGAAAVRLKQLVDKAIDEARDAPPDERPSVLKRSARMFAEAAMDPRNARLTKQLSGLAMEFSRAAFGTDRMDALESAFDEAVSDVNAEVEATQRRPAAPLQDAPAPAPAAAPAAAAARSQASFKQLVDTAIGEARRADPEERPAVLRRSSHVLARAAADPRNAKLSRRLHEAAREFSRAAARPAQIEQFVTAFADAVTEAEAELEVTGESEDGLDEIARIRAEKVAERVAERQELGNPSSGTSTPDSFDEPGNALGRTAVLKHNPSAEDVKNGITAEQTVAFWQGHKREAQAVTADVWYQMARQADTWSRPQALIEYGSDGSKFTIRVDAGQRVTLVGNYVSVVMVAAAPPADAPSSAALFTAGASVGAYAAGSAAPVICTEYIDRLASAAVSELIPKPPKAVALLPVFPTSFVGSLLFEFINVGGGDVVQSALVTYAPGQPYPPTIPIADDAAFVRVTSGLAGIARIRLPFQIST